VKILHVISSGGMYGAEAVILTLLRVFRAGPDPSALAVFVNASRPSVQLYDRALAEGLDVHAIECRGQMDLAVPGALRRLVTHTGATVVHAHGYKADVYLYLALRGLPAPAIVSTCHTWYDNDLALRLYGALDRFVLRRYARVAAVSEEVRQRLLAAGVCPDRVALIRNGIDLGPFEAPVRPSLQSEARPLRVGLVGRLEREKGVDLFLSAAAEVLKALPLTQFVVAGDGPDREKLQALIEELGIGRNARLLGRQEDMPALYASLDLLVSASRQEGLPIVLMEAMASRLPLVATAVGAVPDLVLPEKTGLLVAAEDVPALTQAMLRLLREPDTRARLAHAARERVAGEFSAKRMTTDYLHFYEQAMKENHDRAA
jgi:glycosyltransferase involved in cell wall biosynthesis